jgi:orotidine-5'-phosphate decarboxylase
MASGRERLIFPLDVSTLEEARALVALLASDIATFKVGLELFTAYGPAAISLVHDAGAECFLDLKMHDIPETVARATESATRLGVRYLTLHAANGPKTLTKAAAVAKGSPTTLLAVTVLTSMDDAELHAIGVTASPGDTVLALARMAKGAGVSGLVASAHECKALRAALGADAHLVIPGVRPLGSDANDQKRTATPREAIVNGADKLVVGRPIRDAKDPRAAAQAIAREIDEALSGRA